MWQCGCTRLPLALVLIVYSFVGLTSITMTFAGYNSREAAENGALCLVICACCMSAATVTHHLRHWNNPRLQVAVRL